MANLNTSALKKSSTQDLMAKLKKGMEESKSGGGSKKEKDDRFWSLHIDAAGNGSAIIRFLPAKTEDDFPFVKVHKHAFQENGMWFIAECPTTIGEDCPVCQDNRRLYGTKLETDKKVAQSHKRETKYIANILVVKDSANPENEGKIKMFRFGKKIFDKLEEAMNADPELGETPVNAFNFFDGGNFVYRAQTVGEFLNFDKSKVVPAPDLYDGDEEKLMAVLEQMYDLKEFTTGFKFKSYDELNQRFIKVTSGSASGSAPAKNTPAQERYESPSQEKAPASGDEVPADDADLAFFRDLVENS